MSSFSPEDYISHVERQEVVRERQALDATIGAASERAATHHNYESDLQGLIDGVEDVTDQLGEAQIPPEVRILCGNAVGDYNKMERRKGGKEMRGRPIVEAIEFVRRGRRDRHVRNNTVGAWMMIGPAETKAPMYLGEDGNIYTVYGMSDEDHERGVMRPIHTFNPYQDYPDSSKYKAVEGLDQYRLGFAKIKARYGLN